MWKELEITKDNSMQSAKNLTQLVDKYIVKQEHFYNRPLKAFNKFLIKDFAAFVQQNLSTITSIVAGNDQDSPSIPENLTGKKLKIAIISEEIGHLTGGRYYVWFMAIALMQIGYDVTIYTNQKPAYFDSFALYEQPKFVLVNRKSDIERLDVKADIYLSSPLLGNLAVNRLSKKYNKPSYIMVFDPSPLMERYLGAGFTGWDKLIELTKNSNVNIITLCNAMSEPVYDWLNKRRDQVFPVFPCINSKELDKARVGDREDFVLFISRLVKHKKFEDVLEAVKPTGLRLKIISSNKGIDVESLLKKHGMVGRVDHYHNATEQEKFELLYRCRAVVSGSIFEGFGMFAAEAVATGTPLVCYDFPTFREIQKASGVKNFYYAEWNKPESLTQALDICLKEKKYGKRNKTFDFEAMVVRVSQVFGREPRVGVITIALNEDKFIGASLRAVIKNPNVKKVAVIEGAVNLFAHAATKDGLSLDNTREEVSKVLAAEHGDKIIYEQHGWAADKSGLRNRALKMLGDDIDYVLVVDADEVWETKELEKLIQAMRENPRTGAFLFNFHHFWKQKNLVAVGGQWNSQMFRCFKYENKQLHWDHHAAPVVNADGKFINVTDGSINLPDIHVHHFGYMKDEHRIMEKLKFYKKRDKHLNVVNTWSNWQKGQPTQPTHGGGDVDEYKGVYPPEVEGII